MNEAATPLRFYDNRQKYPAFVNTCNEKSVVAQRAALELNHIRPRPPAIRLFDAGMGDATVLVITNLHYSDASRLMPQDGPSAAALNWIEVRLKGQTSHQYAEQIEALSSALDFGWQTKPSAKSGNPDYVRPSVLVLYREDQQFLLDRVIPQQARTLESYDLIVASQPWRARMPARFKAERILAPLARSLAPGGRLLVIQSYGRDPALEIVQKLWPGENPFQVGRHELLAALKTVLGPDAGRFSLTAPPDDESLFRYRMHTLPTAIGDRIGTSTLFAAWNAAIYVNQIEDERLDEVVANNAYLDATQAVLRKHDGLWFTDEAFVVARHDA